MNIFDSIRQNIHDYLTKNLGFASSTPSGQVPTLSQGLSQGVRNIPTAVKASGVIGAKATNFIPSFPQINLPKPVQNVPVVGGLAQGLVNLPGAAINSPKQYFQAGAQFFQNPNLRTGANLVGNAVNLASFGVAPEALATKGLLENGVVRALPKLTAQSAKYFGVPQGAAAALQGYGQGQSLSQAALSGAQAFGVGTVGGVAFPLAGHYISKAPKDLKLFQNQQTSQELMRGLTMESPQYMNHPEIAPFLPALKINDQMLPAVASAVAKLRTHIGDPQATSVLRAATEDLLPKFAGEDSLAQRNIWDYLIQRKMGEAPSFVPPQLKTLDKAIIDTAGKVVGMTGKLNVKGFLPERGGSKEPTLPAPGKEPILSPAESKLSLYNNIPQESKFPVLGKVGKFWGDIKRKLVDSTAPIEDILYNTKKQINISPQKDISNQIDRVLRVKSLAAQFAKDNGLVDVIRNAPDIKALDEYLIAKHALEVATKTGRNAAQDKALLEKLAPVYEPYAQKVIQYGQKLLDYIQQSGLVSKETADFLKQKYPNYVPLNRIFSEIDKTQIPSGVRGGIASLSKQTVVQKLKGSERTIQNPTESILTKTLDAFNQGEKNVAGQLLASYRDLPGFQGLIKELKYKGQNSPHTFSFLDNGKKRVFATTPEIAQAAKLLDKQQLGFIGKVFALPTRLARIGITGINIPFIGANVVKDQVTAFINSNRPLQSSIANPPVFLKALWAAIGHGAEYDNWIRNAGGGTSFDIAREAPNVTVAQLRSGRNLGSQVAYTVTHPADLLRTVENIVNRGEELTRLQQFIGTRDSLVNGGMKLKEANILAAKQSREATVNFARSGDWGRALNSAFLYINAGIQGSRTLVRNLRTHPIATSTKIGLTVFTPLAAVTAWNLSDPQRKAAYDDIRKFEKDNNLILVPPNPTKDPKTGKWNVIKIPYSQEIANLTVPIRQSLEALQGADPPGFVDVAKALLGSATSLNVQSGQQLAGQFTPQAVKPVLEASLNKNLFTGQDIVPQYINGVPSKYLPPSEQVQPNTSGTARLVGKALNVSPLKVEQGVKDTLGGVGSQAINASDNALAKLGVIPSSQIGGQSIPAGVSARFTQATGGETYNKLSSNALDKAVADVLASPAYQAADSTTKASLINKAIYAANKSVNQQTAALSPNLRPRKFKPMKPTKMKKLKAKTVKRAKLKTLKLPKLKTTKVKKPKLKVAKAKTFKIKKLKSYL